MTRLTRPILLGLAALLLVVFATLAVLGGFNNFTPVPFWDMWDGYVLFLAEVEHGNNALWLTRHVDHIIFISNVFFFANFKIFSGHLASLIVLNYILSFIISIQFFWTASRIIYEDKFLLIFVSIFCCIISMLWMQSENLTWAFQSQMFFAVIFPMASFMLLYSSATSRRRGHLLFCVAVVFGIMSVGTMANGIFVLPLMIAMSIPLKLRFWRVGMLVAAAIGSWAFFFAGYAPASAQGGGMLAAIRNPIETLQYLLAYLGAPASHALGTTEALPSMIAGGVFLTISTALSLYALTRKTERASIILVAVLTYVLLTALATAAGRAVHGVDQAIVSRYSTGVLAGWSAATILAAWWVMRSATRHASGLATTLLIGVLALIPQQLQALERNPDDQFEDLVAALAISLKVNDQSQIGYVFPWVETVFELSRRAVSSHILIFGDERFVDMPDQLGERIHAATSSDICTASGSVLSLPDELRFAKLTGVLSIGATAELPEFFDLLDQDNTIVGRVLVDSRERFSNDEGSVTARYSGYGLANAAVGDKSLVLLASGGMSCTLAPDEQRT